MSETVETINDLQPEITESVITDSPDNKSEPETLETKDQGQHEEKQEEPEVVDDEEEKRARRLAHDFREARAETRRLKAEIELLKGQRTETPDADFERRVTEKALQVAAQKEFDAKANKIFNDGVKEFGQEQFKSSVNAVNSTFGANGMPVAFVEAVAEATDKPHKILAYLADNQDILDDISSMTAAKMGVALAKLDVKINTPKPKIISKAPPPIKTVSGNTGSGGLSDDDMPMDQFMKKEIEKLKSRYH